MKTRLLFAAASLALAVSAMADDQLRNVQTQLKGQGFYYGDVNGQPSAEMTSALRRYQIRNGLEVTGTLSPETLAALGLKAHGAKSAIAAQPPAAQPQTGQSQGPVNLRRNETVEESDKSFLRREETSNPRAADFFAAAPTPTPAPGRAHASAPAPAPTYAPSPSYAEPPASAYAPPPPSREPRDPALDSRGQSVVPPPAPLDAPSADFPVLFAGTPYANAPLSVQQQTLRRAQSVLADRGYYSDIVDGLPGPATEEALLTFQRSRRLTLSGRLDLETLNQLRLLPGRSEPGPGPGPGYQFGFEFQIPHHVFRGVWVDRP